MAPWTEGKALVWDAICVCTVPMETLYIVKQSGSAACRAGHRKTEKYAEPRRDFYFTPLGFETLGSWGECSLKLSKAIGRKQGFVTAENRLMEFLRHRVSLAIQQGKAMCVIGIVPNSRKHFFNVIFFWLFDPTTSKVQHIIKQFSEKVLSSLSRTDHIISTFIPPSSYLSVRHQLQPDRYFCATRNMVEIS